MTTAATCRNCGRAEHGSRPCVGIFEPRRSHPLVLRTYDERLLTIRTNAEQWKRLYKVASEQRDAAMAELARLGNGSTTCPTCGEEKPE